MEQFFGLTYWKTSYHSLLQLATKPLHTWLLQVDCFNWLMEATFWCNLFSYSLLLNNWLFLVTTIGYYSYYSYDTTAFRFSLRQNMFSEGTQESLSKKGDKVLEYYNFEDLPPPNVLGREREKNCDQGLKQIGSCGTTQSCQHKVLLSRSRPNPI